ncbi:MAG: hypothetical protein ACK4HW_03935 [Roseinatronobacter sp.]
MHPRLIVAFALVFALGACGWMGGSRLNPMNWFQARSTETLAPAGGWRTTSDRRLLVPAITEMELLRTPEGGILRATGLMATQGAWDVELRPVDDGRPVGDALIFEFVAAQQVGRPVGSEASRLVTAAIKLSETRLREVRRVVVRAGQNAREVRR